MELMKLFDVVTSCFVRMKTNENELSNHVDAFAVAVAEIALAIAALDGTVLPEEFAAYRWIVGRCPGFSEDGKRRHLDDAVARAGRLLMMAQVGAYSEAERLAAFGDLVNEAMPEGFTDRTRTDVRRAFVLWLSMALSDGGYSGIERQAVELLRKCLAADTVFAPGFFEAAERHLRDLADPLLRSEAERALDQLVIWR